MKTLNQLSRLDEALGALEQAVALNSTYSWALASTGEVLRQLGRFDEALLHLDQALEIEPDSVWALNIKGEVLRQLGRLEEAALSTKSCDGLFGGCPTGAQWAAPPSPVIASMPALPANRH
jgi:tetratricopeptide (TPR) repeat protein